MKILQLKNVPENGFPKENLMNEKNSNDKICKKLYSHFVMGKTYHCFTLARNLWFLFIYEYVFGV